MGPKPTKPVVPSNMQDSVIKTKNENGLHVFTINLDANQDGHGMSPCSIVGIVVLTMLCLIILKKVWKCFRRHKPWLQSNQMLGWFGPKVELVGPSRDVTVRLLVKKMTSPRARSSTGSQDH